jgi:hypothetical protein
MDMISWAATLSSTKLVLLAKVEAEVAAGPAEAEGVAVTAAVVVAEEAEAEVVAVVVVAAGVTAETAVIGVAAVETGAGNCFKSRFDVINGEPRRLPVFHFRAYMFSLPLDSSNKQECV